MLGKKIELNNAIRYFICEQRKNEKNKRPEMTADAISVKVGRTPSWLSQVENGRLKTVKSKDLVKVFCILKNCDYEKSYDYLDNQILLINAEIKNKIIDSDGNIFDYTDYVIFEEERGHLKYATRRFNDLIIDVLDKSIEDIKSNLKHTIKTWFNLVIYWIKRCFPDSGSLFSDEISLRNLYLIINTSYKILQEHHIYYGLNVPEISIDELNELSSKLDDATILVPKEKFKPLNEYQWYQYPEVVRHYTADDFLTWKNKAIYLGSDPFPLLINYKNSITDPDNIVSYNDITSTTGLSETEYLYIIKQLCYHLDCLFKTCKNSMESEKEYSDESSEYFKECENLKIENNKLKQQIENLLSGNSLN